ncbi:MAG: carboxypeptidase regulatory-like domain-containing protein [Deltaproteobacteria bacterium]|nr:carboxypeptidase regulatory-like domain-containing protein [Deltaproteobacteria bacterium]
MTLKRFHFYLAVIVAVAGLAALGVFRHGSGREGCIAGTVTDALGGGPVYKARIVVDGRSTIRYRDKNFRITRLKPGSYELKVTAPGYALAQIGVVVGRGTTRVEVPMRGERIPGLDHILVFADSVKNRGIELEIRFVSKDGTGIRHYPRLPVTMDARLCVRLGDERSYARGRLIYSGPVDLYWDQKAVLARNRGIIPKEKLNLDPAVEGTYGVLDVVLHTPQGDFRDTRADVLLEW